jgi:hypothetical protein
MWRCPSAALVKKEILGKVRSRWLLVVNFVILGIAPPSMIPLRVRRSDTRIHSEIRRKELWTGSLPRQPGTRTTPLRLAGAVT